MPYICLLLALLLTGCGQKGPLFLPGKQTPPPELPTAPLPPEATPDQPVPPETAPVAQP